MSHLHFEVRGWSVSAYTDTCARCKGSGKIWGFFNTFTCPVCLGYGRIVSVTWKSEPVDIERIRAEAAAAEREACAILVLTVPLGTPNDTKLLCDVAASIRARGTKEKQCETCNGTGKVLHRTMVRLWDPCPSPTCNAKEKK